jgi:2-dehydropantoate 2-reductase
MARVLVFGAGSIGAAYIYIFTKGGAQVKAVCRSNHTAAKANGFLINSTLWGDVHVQPEVFCDPSEASGPWDFVVVCSKAMPNQNPSTAQTIKPAVGPSTTIVIIQNGIAVEEEYAALFPDNPILSGVVYLPATQTAPAVIAHKEVELLYIGTFPANAPDGHKASAREFASIIKAGGGTVEVHDDVQLQRWSKLLVNAAWNPTCALTRSRDAQFLRSSPGALDFVRSVMHEVASIAQAVGYKEIDTNMIEFQISRATARNLPGVEPSMLADVLAGRAIEVEAIVGNTVRIARDHGVRTPLLSALYTLAKALDSQNERRRTENQTQHTFGGVRSSDLTSQ